MQKTCLKLMVCEKHKKVSKIKKEKKEHYYKPLFETASTHTQSVLDCLCKFSLCFFRDFRTFLPPSSPSPPQIGSLEDVNW